MRRLSETVHPHRTRKTPLFLDAGFAAMRATRIGSWPSNNKRKASLR